MKRWIAGFLCMMLLLGFAACGRPSAGITGDDPSGDDVAVPETPSEKEEQPKKTTGKVSTPKKVQQAVENLVNNMVNMPGVQIGDSSSQETPVEPETPQVPGNTETPNVPETPEQNPGESDQPSEQPENPEQSGNTEQPETPQDPNAPGGEEQEQPENPEKPGNGEETEPDPNEEITILIPAICFKNSDMSAFNPEGYCLLNGFVSAELNADGSVQVVMTRARQQEMIKETKDRLIKLLNGTTKDEMSEYIKSVQYTTDFSKISLFVYPDQYKEFKTAIPMLNSEIYLTAVLYQTVCEEPVRCSITYYNAATNEILEQSAWSDYS